MKEWILKYKVPRWMVMIMDALIVAFSIVTAFMLRFNFHIPEDHMAVFVQSFWYILIFRVLSFYVFKMHEGIIQYASTRDASRIFLILFGGSVVFSVSNIVAANTSLDRHLIPYSIIILEFITSLLFLVSYRVFVKIAYAELSKPHSVYHNVMIFGAGEAGIITSRALEAESKSKVKVLGFFDDAQKKSNSRLIGLSVFPSNQMKTVLSEKKVDQLILAVQNLSAIRKQEIVDVCMDLGVEVLNVPPVMSWINGELSLKQIRSIKIEDLLGREEIILSEQKLQKDIKGKVVLISGAAGSIGSEIVRQLGAISPSLLVIVDQAESPMYQLDIELSSLLKKISTQFVLADITNPKRMQLVFEQYKPSYVFHAAAYKHVPLMEHNPVEAIRVNVLGTKNLADLALKYEVSKFVMISTDKAVNPTNVMGASKRFAEIYVQSLNAKQSTQFIITRFGNVLGSNGSVIPLFEKQIAKGGPITVTHPEITRFFMTIPEACRLVLEAGSMGQGGEIFVFDMGESVKIVDLAKKMVALSGLELGKDIQLIFSGLRPGEKLFEELLNKKENTKPTHHHKILIAQVQAVERALVKEAIAKFIEGLETQDATKMVKILKEMIPEYKSENSKYSQLD
ncbi:MAG: polysaccharide biosynthesis protein [Bacteroidetes bacterium 4572_77]|nr:MAG: polysaccharide biosynthesis protein [Bacteroidetes bacterium 4572_77]